MRGWLALGLVCALLLSGCTAKSGSSSSSTSGSATKSSGTATATGTGATAPAGSNHAPTGAILAKAGNGTAAANVTFQLSGSDADGDHLNWTLGFGDKNATKGSALPTNVTHHYAKSGLVNVTFTLSDGRSNTTYSTKVNVTTGVAVTIPPDITFSGNLNGGPDVIAGYNSNVPGSTASNKVTVPAGVPKMTVTLTYSDPGGQGVIDEDLDITDPSATLTKSHESGPEPPIVFVAPKAGDWSVSVHLYSGSGQNAYKVVVHFG